MINGESINEHNRGTEMRHRVSNLWQNRGFKLLIFNFVLKETFTGKFIKSLILIIQFNEFLMSR